MGRGGDGDTCRKILFAVLYVAMKQERIIVIEDEPDILEVIEYNLVRDGYKVLTSRDGEQGLQKVRKEAPDLVVLDIMLPGMDGIEVCRRLKTDPLTSSIPVVMVTAKTDETDVVLGLGVGADDYIRKPFSPKELVARVKAVLRRGKLKEEQGSGDRIVRDGIVIDSLSHEVTIDGERISLTATEFRLLQFLASHPGRVFSRDEIIVRVIDEESGVENRNVDVHVKMIRRKLGPYRDLVETVRGVGYRFRH
jgi:DNA-binding response OmpR family regulator